MDRIKDALFAILFVLLINTPLLLWALTHGYSLKTLFSFGG